MKNCKKFMILSVISMILSVISVICFHDIFGVELDPEVMHEKPHKENYVRAMATIQFMNHINYVVHTLNTYKNVYVIEDEYRKISQGNLILDRIPDETVKNAITNLLKMIEAMRLDDIMRKRFLDAQEARAARAKEDMWREMLTGFFVNGLPAGRDAYSNTMQAVKPDATKAAVSLALARNVPLAIGKVCAGQVIGSYLNYQRVQQELQQKSEEYQFNYDMKKDETLRKANTDQLDLQYKLTKAYSIDDQEYRVSPENVKEFINRVKGVADGAEENVYIGLKTMLERHRPFRHFPMFLCHFSTFALKTGHFDEVVTACEDFERENQNSLFRKEGDSLAAQVAMNKITALVELKRIDQNAIRKALDVIKEFNYANKNVSMDYFCATIYSSVLHDPSSAIDVLKSSIATLENRYNKKLVEYCDLLKCGNETVVDDDKIPVAMDLFRCHKLMKDILETNQSKSYSNELIRICSINATASIEKFYLMGETRISDLWRHAKEDVLATSLQYEVRPMRNVFVLYVPLQWFALGEVDVGLSLRSGTNTLQRIAEHHTSRRLVKLDSHANRVFVKMELPTKQKCLRSVDNVVVTLNHKSWPVAIEFYPQGGVNIESGEFAADISKYVPSHVTFMGKRMILCGETQNGDLKPFQDIEKDESYSNMVSRKFREWFQPEVMYGVYGGLAGLSWNWAMKKSGIGNDLVGEDGIILPYKDEWYSNMVSRKFREIWFQPEVMYGELAGLSWNWAMKKSGIGNDLVGEDGIILPYPENFIPIASNIVVGVALTNMDFRICYTNDKPYRSRLNVKVVAFNPFGAQICEIEGDEEVMQPRAGGEITLKWPEDMRGCLTPFCIMLNVKNHRGLKDKSIDQFNRRSKKLRDWLNK